MDRRRCLGIGAAWVAAAAWPGVQASAGAQRWVVRMQGDLGLRALPLQLAERLGYCAQERLELLWLPDGDEDSWAEDPALPQVHVLSFDRLVRRMLAGTELRIVMALVRTPQLGLGVATAVRPVQAPSWNQVRIGVPYGQEAAARLAAWVLAQGWGVRPAPSQWWPLEGAAAAEAALRRGTVQALAWGDPLLTRLELDGALHLLADLRHPHQAQRLLGAPLLCTCVAAAPTLFEQHGDGLRRLALAVQRALRWLSTASALDLAAHADLAGLAHERATFLRVLERLRASYSVEVAVERAAVQQSLRLLAALPGGTLYQAVDGQRLLPPRNWTPA
ncbi:MAG: hypothetical protein RMK34_04450 [Tepidimonas sp.]|uniref:hypothetical protein n=1 Tax=Tepidimonas sp. TaxID=2002775 RepID=UPI00298F3284|nr:hypothetical protein [Tepidimonas sp.]MDW8336205.1 hypothetical protein [Tepidimonas sp.]